MEQTQCGSGSVPPRVSFAAPSLWQVNCRHRPAIDLFLDDPYHHGLLNASNYV